MGENKQEAGKKNGAKAMIECWEPIPCNPCETACPSGAIKVGWPITNIPKLDENICLGCGICIANCPGQSIFLIDMTYDHDKAIVAFPYEYLPLPKQGELATGVDRDGKPVAEVRIHKVNNTRINNNTPVVYVIVPKPLASEIRSIKREVWP